MVRVQQRQNWNVFLLDNYLVHFQATQTKTMKFLFNNENDIKTSNSVFALCCTNSEKRTKNQLHHILKWVRKFNRNKNDSNTDKSTVEAQDTRNLKDGSNLELHMGCYDN
jgi:UDP-glucose 6-dehydrogenase